MNTELPNFGQIGYDTTFELNEYSRPRLRSDLETIKNIVLFILFGKPGQYPSLPMIGMDIKSILYSFYDEINENVLRDRIISQCSALGMFFDRNIIALRKTMYRGQPSLLIHIESVTGDRHVEDYHEYTGTGPASKFLIGITFDEMKKMIYNVNERRGDDQWHQQLES